MTIKRKKIRIGIIGCGAIGSGIAKAIEKKIKKDCQLTSIYDIDGLRALRLEELISRKGIAVRSLNDLLNKCDLAVEAVNAKNTIQILKQAFAKKKDVLAMSVGKLLYANNIFQLAQKYHCQLLIPSGAIAGIDAIKAASLASIHKITLTTQKPPDGFAGNEYLLKQGINLKNIKNETMLFKGSVKEAVRLFPQNINVAATLALASKALNKITVCLMTSPKYIYNSHQIEVIGDFGKITTKTENIPCPDNPKTSYLAILSGIETLKEYCQGTFVGT